MESLSKDIIGIRSLFELTKVNRRLFYLLHKTCFTDAWLINMYSVSSNSDSNECLNNQQAPGEKLMFYLTDIIFILNNYSN